MELDRIADRYRVVRELAKGRDGVIYEAFDERADQRCAIKVLEMRRPAVLILPRPGRPTHRRLR